MGVDRKVGASVISFIPTAKFGDAHISKWNVFPRQEIGPIHKIVEILGRHQYTDIL